jgi:hypothetical protein
MGDEDEMQISMNHIKQAMSQSYTDSWPVP